MLLHLDLCRSKNDPISVDRFQSGGMKKTAKVTIDIIEQSKKDCAIDDQEGRKSRLFLADSWFTSMDVVDHINEDNSEDDEPDDYIGIMKNNSSGYPKKYLQDTMKD